MDNDAHEKLSDSNVGPEVGQTRQVQSPAQRAVLAVSLLTGDSQSPEVTLHSAPQPPYSVPLRMSPPPTKGRHRQGDPCLGTESSTSTCKLAASLRFVLGKKNTCLTYFLEGREGFGEDSTPYQRSHRIEGPIIPHPHCQERHVT